MTEPLCIYGSRKLSILIISEVVLLKMSQVFSHNGMSGFTFKSIKLYSGRLGEILYKLANLS